MTISLKHGRDNYSESKEKTFLLARRFCDIFEKQFGSLLCRELIKCDLLTEEGRRKYVEERVKEEKCVNL
jgi:hypothetical protein